MCVSADGSSAMPRATLRSARAVSQFASGVVPWLSWLSSFAVLLVIDDFIFAKLVWLTAQNTKRGVNNDKLTLPRRVPRQLPRGLDCAPCAAQRLHGGLTKNCQLAVTCFSVLITLLRYGLAQVNSVCFKAEKVS